MKLKFVCLNVWFGGKLLQPMLQFLQKENPDILVCQEIQNGPSKHIPQYHSIDVMNEVLNFPYVAFDGCFMDSISGEKVERGNCIFSRFPITQKEVVWIDGEYKEYVEFEQHPENFPISPRNLQHVVVKAEKELNIFNTQGIWGLDGGDSERRLTMSQRIIAAVKDKENVILAGDFNVRPDTDTIRNIEKHLKNVFKDELTTSFNMKQKTNPGYATAVVDMIFTSPNIKIVDHYCPSVDVSDHLPLVCTLEV